MANAEQLKILKTGSYAWNTWWMQKKREAAKSGVKQTPGPELSGARLREFDLRGADLHFADLVGADLRGSDLRLAKFIGANLGGADLSDANMSEANLRGAICFNAILSNADLSYADLTGANLKHAFLLGTNLMHANLTATEFAEADLSLTTFAFTSLKAAKGLESCRHQSPSSIDYFTLIESGSLPEKFLRGCGLPDEFIQCLPSFRNGAIQFYSSFISYSHVDKAFAWRLHDALQGRGIRCWLDEHQVLAGDKIHRVVDEAIRLSDKVLLCCSEDSLTSWWVDKEVEKALMKEEKLSKERDQEVLTIIPLNLDGFMFKRDWADWKQQHLISRLAADFGGWERDNAKFEAQLEKLMKALRADSQARERPPKARL